jgi:hypothetical protein
VINGNKIVLTWSEVLSKLQKNTNVSALGWLDVPGTLGINSFAETIVPGQIFYRLLRQ